jgi:methyl-accepting chemotaxis protein
MRVPFHHSLAGRLVLFGVLPTLVLVGSLVGLGLHEKYRTLEQTTERELTGSASLAAMRTEDRLNDAARTARVLAETAGATGLERLDRIALSLPRILERDAVISAAWLALETNSIGVPGENARAGAPGASGPLAFRAARDLKRGGRATLSSQPDLRDSSAYRGAVDAFRSSGGMGPLVSEPVLRDGELVIDVCYSIVVDGQFLGVAGAECSIRDLAGSIRSSAAELGVEIVVLAPSGTILAASLNGGTDELVGRRASETRYAPILVPRIEGALAPGVTTEIDPTSEDDSFVATALVPSGDWRVVLLKPVTAIMRPAFVTVISNLSFAAIGLALLATLLIVLAFSVRRRIDRAVRAAERIAQGDLTVRIATDGQKDEAGALLDTLGVMAERLSVLIARVQTAGRMLDSSVVELGKSTSTQKHAATPLGNTTTEVAAAAKQISATGVELARTMESVQVNAAATADLAKSGREQLSAVDQSMRELDVATASVAGKLATINERAIAINAVVTTITKVADQTNLLSVNAAIEAEKTGEQGRGFLVVAREIRRLADQTAASTLDIAHLVEEMQSAVSAGVMEMDRFAEKVRRSVEDVNETSRQMGAIIGQVAENTERFRAVTEGMASQSAGAVQISDATSQIQQSARAAIDGLARLSATARLIEGATGTLHSEVSAFRVATSES